MLKRLNISAFIIVINVFSVSICHAKDQYHVMYINGDVNLTSTKEALKIGDTINRLDKLEFSSRDSFVDVFSLNQGREVLKPPASNSTKSMGSEVFYLVKSILVPKEVSVSTRNGIINNIKDLRGLFSNTPYLLLGGKSVINISPLVLPMNDDTFFFVTYMHDRNVINKRLSYKNNKLILAFSEVFSIEGEPIEREKQGKFDLIYYDFKKQEQTKISTVEYFVPNYNKIKNEIKVMLDIMVNAGMNKANTYITEFINDRYGYATEDDIKRLIDDI